MANEFYQVQKTLIPFLDRFSNAINRTFALAVVWEFYQHQKTNNRMADIYITTSEIARYSLNEILNTVGKELCYGDDSNDDYCEVNHKIAYYRKMSNLISGILGTFPGVTYVFKKDGLNYYELVIIDMVEKSDLYAKLKEASSIKKKIIKDVLKNKDRYLSTKPSQPNKQLLDLDKPVPIQPKPTHEFFKAPLPTTSSNGRPVTFIDESITLNDRPIKFVDESFSFQKIAKTGFFSRKRKQAHSDTVETVSHTEKLHRPNNQGSACLTKYMDIKFILN